MISLLLITCDDIEKGNSWGEVFAWNCQGQESRPYNRWYVPKTKDSPINLLQKGLVKQRHRKIRV
jgi:hypothetical protein